MRATLNRKTANGELIMPLPGVFDKQIKPRPAQGAGGFFNQAAYTVAASTSIKRYDIVSLNGSQLVQQAIALPGSNNSASLSGGSLPTLGVALASITTNAAGQDTSSGLPVTTVPVAIWDGNLEILIRAWNATPANTQISTGTFNPSAILQLGRWRGPNANTWWYFLSTTTTNGELLVVEQYGLNDQLTTDQYALLFVKSVGSLRNLG